MLQKILNPVLKYVYYLCHNVEEKKCILFLFLAVSLANERKKRRTALDRGQKRDRDGWKMWSYKYDEQRNRYISKIHVTCATWSECGGNRTREEVRRVSLIVIIKVTSLVGVSFIVITKQDNTCHSFIAASRRSSEPSASGAADCCPFSSFSFLILFLFCFVPLVPPPCRRATLSRVPARSVHPPSLPVHTSTSDSLLALCEVLCITVMYHTLHMHYSDVSYITCMW